MKKSITVMVPMFNEEQVLPLFYSELTAVLDTLPDYRFEMLFLDDGSRDRSLEIVAGLAETDPRVSFLALSRNFGKERTMLAGFDEVRTDAVIIIDADLQDPPSLIPEMIKYWEEGYQDVYATRRSREGETWMKKATAGAYYKLLQKLTSVPIQPNTGDFRLLDRACVDALVKYRESERNTKALFSLIGFRKKAVYFDRDPRAEGTTKFNYPKLTNLAVDGITSFTTAPLRISTAMGFIVSFVAFVYMLVIVWKALIHGSDVAGYPSVMAVILFLGGVQLLSLGVIGEYVGRIFLETKPRPIYLVNNVHRGEALSVEELREDG